MNHIYLDPAADFSEPFRRDRQKFVPDRPGCYVLTTFEGVVLYIGLAINLRRRMGEHLDTPAKRAPTAKGKAVTFRWCERKDLERVERTWMNIHIQYEGALPILNSAYSPVGL